MDWAWPRSLPKQRRDMLELLDYPATGSARPIVTAQDAVDKFGM